MVSMQQPYNTRLKNYYRENVQTFVTSKDANGKSHRGQGIPGWRTFRAQVNFGRKVNA